MRIRNSGSNLETEIIMGKKYVFFEPNNISFVSGFVCLIQISTETKDYLIDPFKIWEHITLLNEITTDPNIVKVRIALIFIHVCN